MITNFLVFQQFGIWEILIILLIVLLLFGGRKIPELMKGLGKGVKEFKKGVKEDDADEQPNTADKKSE